jgi:hypothetical protein
VTGFKTGAPCAARPDTMAKKINDFMSRFSQKMNSRASQFIFIRFDNRSPASLSL